MITGMEIRNQQFGRSMRGFNEGEVRQFLHHIAQDYENLYGENSELKESIQQLRFELDKYRKIEESMNNSLILAQQTAENLKASAEKEAEMILQQSKRSVAEMMSEYQEMIKQLALFNLEIKSQLNLQLEMLERNASKNKKITEFLEAKELKDLVGKLEKPVLNENNA